MVTIMTKKCSTHCKILVMGGRAKPLRQPAIISTNYKSGIVLTALVETAHAGLCSPGEESDICSSWIGAVVTDLSMKTGVLHNITAAARRSD